jgi:hypothetical protein
MNNWANEGKATETGVSFKELVAESSLFENLIKGNNPFQELLKKERISEQKEEVIKNKLFAYEYIPLNLQRKYYKCFFYKCEIELDEKLPIYADFDTCIFQGGGLGNDVGKIVQIAARKQ